MNIDPKVKPEIKDISTIKKELNNTLSKLKEPEPKVPTAAELSKALDRKNLHNGIKKVASDTEKLKKTILKASVSKQSENSLPPREHNLISISSGKHSKKQKDTSTLQVHSESHLHHQSHADKDIIVHKPVDKRKVHQAKMLAEKIDDMKVPKAMEPPALMEKKDKKAETLPVHADMKKLWVPNEDGVLDEQYKDAPTLAKIKEPSFKQEESSSNDVS